MSELTIAMPKGRIFEEAYVLLQKAGMQLHDDLKESKTIIV